MILRWSTGREFAPMADVREAVRLSASAPDSWQYALAMAELADAELWHEVPSGAARAEEAVRLARACGSKKALTYALTARVISRCMAFEGEELTDPQIDSQEAQAAAAEVRDFYAYSHATLWASNLIDGWQAVPRTTWCAVAGRRLISLGAPHTYVSWLAAHEAIGLLALGDWRAVLSVFGTLWVRRRGRWLRPNPAASPRCWPGGRVGWRKRRRTWRGPTSLRGAVRLPRPSVRRGARRGGSRRR